MGFMKVSLSQSWKEMSAFCYLSRVQSDNRSMNRFLLCIWEINTSAHSFVRNVIDPEHKGCTF